jgi:hypothetical protein
MFWTCLQRCRTLDRVFLLPEVTGRQTVHIYINLNHYLVIVQDKLRFQYFSGHSVDYLVISPLHTNTFIQFFKFIAVYLIYSYPLHFV